MRGIGELIFQGPRNGWRAQMSPNCVILPVSPIFPASSLGSRNLFRRFTQLAWDFLFRKGIKSPEGVGAVYLDMAVPLLSAEPAKICKWGGLSVFWKFRYDELGEPQPAV